MIELINPIAFYRTWLGNWQKAAPAGHRDCIGISEGSP